MDKDRIPTGEGGHDGDYDIEVTDPGDYGDVIESAQQTAEPGNYDTLVNGLFETVEELNEAIALLNLYIQEEIIAETKYLTPEQLNFLRMLMIIYRKSNSETEILAAKVSIEKAISKIFQKWEEEA